MGAARPSVWLVSPAFGRLAVSDLAFTQRGHLAGELARRGIDCHSVVVADDENLELARGHGFATVEMDNSSLGERFNAGFKFAAKEGADWLVHIGSDDWVHPDLFTPLLAPLEPRPILSGRRIAFVDLESGHFRRACLQGPHGVIPWVIPRGMLRPSGFAPIDAPRNRGIDGYLVRGLRRSHAQPEWVFHDPHEWCRVDFKSGTNLNGFDRVPGSFERDPWPKLAQHYPADLVDMARATHLELRRGRC